MDNNYKAEARKQYLSYFKIWFIAAAVLLAIALVGIVRLVTEMRRPRTNMEAPTERVYDYADVLTDEEEQSLREYIARAETIAKSDIVVVTINKPVEGPQIADMGYRYDDWELNMRDLADDFYDENLFGYDRAYEGNGVLLLDNWYEGQAGTWISTSGQVYEEMGDWEIEYLLDDVYYYIERDVLKAYKAYVDYIVEIMGGRYEQIYNMGPGIMGSLVVSAIAALIFVAVKLNYKEGQVTVTTSTYMNGSERVNVRRDTFLRKHTTHRRIPRNTSGGGHGGGGGGSHSRGGSHRSSGGRSHGGGGRRR